MWMEYFSPIFREFHRHRRTFVHRRRNITGDEENLPISAAVSGKLKKICPSPLKCLHGYGNFLNRRSTFVYRYLYCFNVGAYLSIVICISQSSEHICPSLSVLLQRWSTFVHRYLYFFNVGAFFFIVAVISPSLLRLLHRSTNFSINGEPFVFTEKIMGTGKKRI